jgi:polysaccharide export outer membrane protein
LTERGTDKGIVVTRRDQDGKTRNFDVGMNDLLQPDDVLIIKEGLF